MEQTDEKKMTEAILNDIYGRPKMHISVLQAMGAAPDFGPIIGAMEAYAAQEVTLATTAQQSIIDGQKERLFTAFIQTLLMANYTNESINNIPQNLMDEAFKYWLDNPGPDCKYTPKGTTLNQTKP